MRYITVWSGILGAIVFALASIIGGLDTEGYDFISQYISESYATGIPNAHYFQKAYMVSGILLALFGFSAPGIFPRSKAIKIGFVLFGICYGLGTLTTGIFPAILVVSLILKIRRYPNLFIMLPVRWLIQSCHFVSLV
nr:DUF998 domain-containing protein [Maribacter sp. Hal144]